MLQHPKIAEAFGRELAARLGPADVVVSPAVGGLIIGHEVARALGARFIFTERDALFRVIAESRDPAKTELRDVMTANPRTIGPDRPFGHALHMMHEGGFRHVPVVEGGAPLGVVCARDALGPELEAFLGELDKREHIFEVLG